MAGRSIEPRKTEQKLRETYKVPDNRDNNKSSVNQQKIIRIGNPKNMLLEHIFRLQLTIFFERKFFQF